MISSYHAEEVGGKYLLILRGSLLLELLTDSFSSLIRHGLID